MSQGVVSAPDASITDGVGEVKPECGGIDRGLPGAYAGGSQTNQGGISDAGGEGEPAAPAARARGRVAAVMEPSPNKAQRRTAIPIGVHRPGRRCSAPRRCAARGTGRCPYT